MFMWTLRGNHRPMTGLQHDLWGRILKSQTPVRAYASLAGYEATLDRGRPRIVEVLWQLVHGTLFESCLPGSGWRVALLRLFGGQIAHGVVIKPGVRVKFPWRLSIGADSWIGEDVWIDNLAEVRIGANCCVSQGVYICTGNHDWGIPAFTLRAQPVSIEDEAWLAAFTLVAPGVTVGRGAVLLMGGAALADLAGGKIHAGNPAVAVKDRVPGPRP